MSVIPDPKHVIEMLIKNGDKYDGGMMLYKAEIVALRDELTRLRVLSEIGLAKVSLRRDEKKLDDNMLLAGELAIDAMCDAYLSRKDG